MDASWLSILLHDCAMQIPGFSPVTPHSPHSLASPPSSSSHAIMGELERQLSSLVGLPRLKQQLRVWAKGLLLDQRRRQLGVRALGRRAPPHMAFLGSPGTGESEERGEGGVGQECSCSTCHSVFSYKWQEKC